MTDEQRAERLRYHMYESCEGIREHAERIVALEELVADVFERFHGVVIEGWSYTTDDFEMIRRRMAALGLEA